MSEPIHIISLGAGVQSSTMALMAAAGAITPMPACAIFADTQAEPASVYRWLDWLETQLPFPVVRATAGNLRETSLRVRHSERNPGETYLSHNVPAFTINPDGSFGNYRRQCTDKHKLMVLRDATREQADGRPVIMWIGISVDEAHRMKESVNKGIENQWPLIDLRMSRNDCLRWMTARGLPEPPRSACTFCPYHSDHEWNRLKTTEPEAFAAAVRYEAELQQAAKMIPRLTSIPFLHDSRKPLAEVVFNDERQTDMFGNECLGMCGV